MSGSGWLGPSAGAGAGVLHLLETEVSGLLLSMRRGPAAALGSQLNQLHPTLVKPLVGVKRTIAEAHNSQHKFDELWHDPSAFLTPFLEVIRSEAVTGLLTGAALDSVHKFITFGLLRPDQKNIANAVENLAEATTHARFVGMDPSSDEVVLMKIMDVLRALMLSPVGILLTNESVCEIMQSTFRICFESRLSDILQKNAERTLSDMIQVLFTRLPTFSEENLPLLKRLKMRNSQGDQGKGKRRANKSKQLRSQSTSSMKRTASTTTTTTMSSSSPSEGNSVGKTVASPTNEAPSEPAETSSGPPSLQPNLDPRQEGDNPFPSASPSGEKVVKTEEVGSEKASAAAPQSPTPQTQFNVDSDVLARSPLGSVTDLSQVQSDGESVVDGPPAAGEEKKDEDVAGKTELAITITSPQGTERTPEQAGAGQADPPPPPPPPPPSASPTEDTAAAELSQPQQEFTNTQGVTFTPTLDNVDNAGSLVPYGLPCVRELFRFLISLINPHDTHNQDNMIQIALSLLSIAMETGAKHLDKFDSLLALVKDDLARNVVSLLSAERLQVFSRSLWIAFMMFDSQRRHLKYQLEIFLNRLIEVMASESQSVTYEHKEVALEYIVRFYRLPGFITQLYLNFDCDIYTSNLFEDLTKVLSKNAFPVTELYSTHYLSLDALLTVIESIEVHCQKRILEGRQVSAVSRSEKAKEEGSQAEERGGYSQLAQASGRPFGEEPARERRKSEEDLTFSVPSHEEVMALKHKKKLITTATEQFNTKPSKGIGYMQECGLIKSSPPEEQEDEIVQFLRQNPHLSKQQLGEYLSNRKNSPSILEKYVQSFDVAGLDIVKSLRMFLEAFRLPGEAPLIDRIMEHFGSHWQRCNDDVVANADSAYILTMAIIMLNVDQHNMNVKCTMTLEQFTRNLRGTNDGKDHDPEMLSDIYYSIKNDAIVMPAEHTGLVKENYLWKCVLKRGQEEGSSAFVMAPNGVFDHDLFSITWGPTVAALSYVFDKSDDLDAVHRALNGFQRCAMIAAHYDMTDVFDNLIISLCKFTTLVSVSAAEQPSQFIPLFGMNEKALRATKMVFLLVQRHGDILRAAWKNVVEIMLQLFKCELLSKSLMESEDYVESTGRVKLFREEIKMAKEDQSFLNSFVSFISMSSSDSGAKVRTPEEEAYAGVAAKCVKECAIESIIGESKFLLAESLQDLIKFLLDDSKDRREDEHARLFFLELIVRITIQNRDRVHVIWPAVSEHINRLLASLPSSSHNRDFLLERAVTALLRLAVRLSRKEDLATTVVQSLHILLTMKSNLIFHVCQHIAFGLYELLRNNAANIHEASDWAVIFSLLEVVGSGASNEPMERKAARNSAAGGGEDDSGHGASSESEATTNLTSSRNTSPQRRERSESFSSGGWIVLGDTRAKSGAHAAAQRRTFALAFSHMAIVHPRALVMHDSLSFLKCCDTLAFLIRDMAHITPHNFGPCVQAIRTFVEASFVARQDEGSKQAKEQQNAALVKQLPRSHMKRTPAGRAPPTRRVQSVPNMAAAAEYDADESDNEDLSSEYHHVSLQLLDLMYTLHTRAGQVFKAWAEEDDDTEPAKFECNLWNLGWCPLLQGMARLCCDKRSHIRTSALTSLQRALLFQDLQQLSSQEWESAFTCVLFPMLSHLLIKSNPGEKTAMEETRTRAATLLGKVFLQHLQPLSSLPSFTSLWLNILDFMELFIKAAASDLLADAVPESLKNMLLVMDTAGIFFGPDGQSTKIWTQTWEKLETFLPNLMSDLFGKKDRGRTRQEATAAAAIAPAEKEAAAVEAPRAVEKSPIPPATPTEPPVLSASAFVLPPPKQDDGKPLKIEAKATEEAAALAVSQETSTSSVARASPGPALGVGGSQQVFSIAPPAPLPSRGMITSRVPALPEIAPLPPPPISIPPLSGPGTSSIIMAAPPQQGFQPIHSANPVAGSLAMPVANPVPVLPAKQAPPAVSSYFSGGMQSSSAGNLLTAAYTPNLPEESSAVILSPENPDQK